MKTAFLILIAVYFVGCGVHYVVVQVHYNAKACHNLGEELKKKPWTFFLMPGWFLACGESLDLGGKD